MANQGKIGETTFAVGDTVEVYQKIKEGEKLRTQVFSGVVIAIKHADENKSFTVRRISIGNIGVERIWPLCSPLIEKVVVKKQGQVNRAKLYYLRDRVGKNALKIKSK